MIVLNPARKRRRRRNGRRKTISAPRGYARRRHRRNPSHTFSLGGGSGAVGALKKGFSAAHVKSVIPIAGGVLLNKFLQEKVAERIGWTTGWKDSVVGIATAGGMLMIPKYGKQLFVGGMMQVTVKALLPHLARFGIVDPGAPPPPPPAPRAPSVRPLPDASAMGFIDDDDEEMQFGNTQLGALGRPWIPAYGTDHLNNPSTASLHRPGMTKRAAPMKGMDIFEPIEE